MIYAVSDIHGCAWEFGELLKRIGFSNSDTMYVVGDVVDRGPNPLGVLKTMAAHSNIIPIIGNHEYMMLKCLPTLFPEIPEDENDITHDKTGVHVGEKLIADDIDWTVTWAYNGADTTINAFKWMSNVDRRYYADYVRSFSKEEDVIVDGTRYVMVHSLPQVAPYMDWRKCSIEDILFGRPDFFAPWKQEDVYIIGHTPTFVIHKDYKGKIYRQGNLIDIDCGAVYDGKLAAYCLNSGETIYV